MPLKPPKTQRHLLSKINENSRLKQLNTVIEDRYWNMVLRDVQALNQGKGKQNGTTFLINGREYGTHRSSSRVYPIAGKGFHRLTYQEYKILMIYGSYGNTHQLAYKVDEIKAKLGCTPQELQRVFDLWKLVQEQKRDD